MYQELGSIREPVALSPQEALDSAEALLTQQGYRVVQRTDALVTGERRQRSGIFRQVALYMTVNVRPLPEGVEIRLRGNDRDGIEEQQAELSRWAEDLPKVKAEHREDERASKGTPSEETAEMQEEAAEGETREDADTKSSIRAVGQQESHAAGEDDAHETEIADEDEERMNPVEHRDSWASTTPWERRVRVAPGKLDVGQKGMEERLDASAPQSGPSEDPYAPPEGVVDEGAIEVGSDTHPGIESGDMSESYVGDISHLMERVELFEDRLGVRLEGLFARMDDDGDIRVNGELHSRDGVELDQDIVVVVLVYDGSGRLIEMDETIIYSSYFLAGL